MPNPLFPSLYPSLDRRCENCVYWHGVGRGVDPTYRYCNKLVDVEGSTGIIAAAPTGYHIWDFYTGPQFSCIHHTEL